MTDSSGGTLEHLLHIWEGQRRTKIAVQRAYENQTIPLACLIACLHGDICVDVRNDGTPRA